jgi:hypothetical protein
MEYDPVETSAVLAVLGTIFLVAGIFLVFIIACTWKIFTKAGKPGWAAIIPIYNTIVLLEITGKPIWWIILFLIPGVNIVIAIMVTHQLSLSFGQGIGMTLLLLLLPFIGYPMLAFGSAQYQGTPALASQPI